jgi:hypothetical protein
MAIIWSLVYDMAAPRLFPADSSILSRGTTLVKLVETQKRGCGLNRIPPKKPTTTPELQARSEKFGRLSDVPNLDLSTVTDFACELVVVAHFAFSWTLRDAALCLLIAASYAAPATSNA